MSNYSINKKRDVPNYPTIQLLIYQQLLELYEHEIYLTNSYHYRKIDKYSELYEQQKLKATLFEERNKILESMLLQHEFAKLRKSI